MANSRLVNLAIAAYTAFLVLWAAGYFYLDARQLTAGQLLVYSQGGTVWVADFINHYMSGQLALSEQRHSIYDPRVQEEWRERLMHAYRTQSPFYLQHPPLTFMLMAPFAFLPVNVAYLVLSALSLALGLSACGWLLSRVRQFSPCETTLFLLGALASLPSYQAVAIGQLTWLALGLCFLVYLGCHSGRPVLAGLSLALVSFKPQYLLPLGTALLGASRWAALSCFLAAELALCLVAALWFGWQNLVFYPLIVMKAETTGEFSGVSPEFIVSLRGQLARFLPADLALNMSIAIVILAYALLVIWTQRAAARQPLSDQQQRWIWAVSLAGYPVLSPHAHLHDCLFLVPAAALTLPGLSPAKLSSVRTFSLRVWCWALVLYPLITAVVFAYWELAPSAYRGPLLFLPLNVLLLAAGLRCLWRAGQPARPND